MYWEREHKTDLLKFLAAFVLKVFSPLIFLHIKAMDQTNMLQEESRTHIRSHDIIKPLYIWLQYIWSTRAYENQEK